MHALPESALRMIEIEARQDEALRQLEELERQVERALAESVPLASRLALNPGSTSTVLNETHPVVDLN